MSKISDVSVIKSEAIYPKLTPFHPHIHYPEYIFTDKEIPTEKNFIYNFIRTSLYNLGLDKENYYTEHWNPLKKVVKSNSRVILKPNFVNHKNRISDENDYFYCLVTHGSIIRAIADYVLLAGGKNIEIIIADLPMQVANFKKLLV